jgi:hypothetical protein
MIRRLFGPTAEPVEMLGDPIPLYEGKLIDDKTLLALVSALLYTPNQTASQTVDKAAELLREVNAR